MRRNTLFIIAMLAMVLTFSQCKKDDIKPTTGEVTNTITLNFTPNNGGGKTVFDPEHVSFAWSGTEYIYVGGSNHTGCLGTLSGTETSGSITFTGSITQPDDEEVLHFFYLGNDKTGGSIPTLDFSNQDGTIENVTNYHIGIGSATYHDGTTSYSTTLGMAMAIAYFDVSGYVDSNSDAEKVFLHGDGIYSTATVNYQEGTITGATKGYINMGTASSGKYIALIPSVST